MSADLLPGVMAVLTYENTKGWRTLWYGIPQLAFPECITYEGQEVVAVAAEDIIIDQFQSPKAERDLLCQRIFYFTNIVEQGYLFDFLTVGVNFLIKG